MEAWSTLEAYRELMELIAYKAHRGPDDIGRAAVWLAADDSIGSLLSSTANFEEAGQSKRVAPRL